MWAATVAIEVHPILMLIGYIILGSEGNITDCEHLLQPDAQEKSWLLDAYPTSCSKAMALETLVIRPNIFILLDVPDEIIVERVVERQLYPITGKIYDLKYSPAENEDIASRLTQRFDDTEEKIRLRG